MQAFILRTINPPLNIENRGMGYFYEQLSRRLKETGLSFYKLQFAAEIGSSQFTFWKTGKRRPSDTDLEKLASVEELGLTYAELGAWRMIDQNSPESIRELVRIVREASPELAELDASQEEKATLPKQNPQDKSP